MELFVTPVEKQEATRLLSRAGLEDLPDRPASRGGSPLVFINPGAQYGDAKCWLPEHFAAVADQLIEQRNATVLIGGTPRERRILDAVHSHMRHSAVDLVGKGLSLGSLKEILRRCDLLITNDTGPRHIAAAFDVPIITVFGPTHPTWSEINHPTEKQIAVEVFCGPCQKKRCPLDHRCMTRVTPAMVLKAASELLPVCG
jgi:heptosyltransferase-2